MYENILSASHWVFEVYTERITSKQWREMLLNDADKIIFRGNYRKIVGKNLGHGVVEIGKKPMKVPDEIQ